MERWKWGNWHDFSTKRGFFNKIVADTSFHLGQFSAAFALLGNPIWGHWVCWLTHSRHIRTDPITCTFLCKLTDYVNITSAQLKSKVPRPEKLKYRILNLGTVFFKKQRAVFCDRWPSYLNSVLSFDFCGHFEEPKSIWLPSLMKMNDMPSRQKNSRNLKSIFQFYF